MAKHEEQHVWERRPDESEKAYQAFALYRDLGEERTQAEVSRRLQKSDTLIFRWSQKYDWKTRAFEYDHYLDRESLKAAIKAKKDMRTRHIKVAMFLQGIAAKKLEALNPNDIEIKDLQWILKEGVRMERENRMEEISDLNGNSTSENGHNSLADAITEAWERRRAEEETEEANDA